MNRLRSQTTGDSNRAVEQELTGQNFASSAEISGTPQVDFQQLAGNNPEILILFRGQTYRLRATRNGKLILNK